MKKKSDSEIGQDYFYGSGTGKNYRKAFPYLLRAAEKGDVHCQNLVGFCLSNGLGIDKDPLLAQKWYEKAASKDHIEALFALALIHEESNPKKAFQLYKRAAERGHDWAQCNLAICYLDGTGTKQNDALGIIWMRRAARQGDAKAQYNLGEAYLFGDAIRANRRHAEAWLKKAAALGHKLAIKRLKTDFK